MAIEACADIVDHRITDRGFQVPSTYPEAFDVSSEAGLLGGARRGHGAHG